MGFTAKTNCTARNVASVALVVTTDVVIVIDFYIRIVFKKDKIVDVTLPLELL